jgi:hypothetical protein
VAVLDGIIGPPVTGTDSSGGNATADAALYPCPPTAAQQALGLSCGLVLGDEAGDDVEVPLVFESESCRTLNDGMFFANDTVTSATAKFSAADVGATISSGDVPTGTTITSVTNAMTATMSNVATAPATNVVFALCDPA